jgi:hypothetical protein
MAIIRPIHELVKNYINVIFNKLIYRSDDDHLKGRNMSSWRIYINPPWYQGVYENKTVFDGSFDYCMFLWTCSLKGISGAWPSVGRFRCRFSVNSETYKMDRSRNGLVGYDQNDPENCVLISCMGKISIEPLNAAHTNSGANPFSSSVYPRIFSWG